MPLTFLKNQNYEILYQFNFKILKYHDYEFIN